MGRRRTFFDIESATAKLMQRIQLYMAMTRTRLLRETSMPNKAAPFIMGIRGFAVGGGKVAMQKVPKGVAIGAPKASAPNKELKSTTVLGANILKDGADPKIKPDTEYPNWLWLLHNKHPPLSEQWWKDPRSLPFQSLRHVVQLHNRA
ncbi:hypothetical protein MUK42_08718, partial [Musa troglodytarum]